MLLILFRRKYPRWWFDWNLDFLRFSNRVTAYLALLDDRYPSTDEAQEVTAYAVALVTDEYPPFSAPRALAA